MSEDNSNSNGTETFREELTESDFPELRILEQGLFMASQDFSGGSRGLMELTVFNNNRFKFEIYSDDHRRPHFHVSFRDARGSFSIKDCTCIKGGKGIRRKELKFIKDWHADNKVSLMQCWNDRRPDK